MIEKKPKTSKFSFLLAGVIIFIIIVAGIGVYFGLLLTPFLLFQQEESPTIINGPSGTSILVPHGAAPEATFTIEELDSANIPDLPEWAENAISLYDFSVDRPLEDSIFIRIPIPNVELAMLGHYDNGEWKALLFKEEEGKAVAEVESLSLIGWIKTNVKKIREMIAERIENYFSLSLQTYPTTEEIDVDETHTYGLISGMARFIGKNEVELSIQNNAPLPLDIYPAVWSKRINPDLQWASLVPSAYEWGMILEPGSEGKWTTELFLGESVTFEGKFNRRAGILALFNLVSAKTLLLIDNTLFGRRGREWGLEDAADILLPEIIQEAKDIIKSKGIVKLAKGLMSENLFKTGRITFIRPAQWSNMVSLSVIPRCTFARIEFDTRDTASSKLWIKETLGEWTEIKVFAMRNMLVTHHVWEFGPLKPNMIYEYHLVVEGMGFKWRGKEERSGNFTTKIVEEITDLHVVSGEFDISKGFTVQFEFDTLEPIRCKVQCGLTPKYVVGPADTYETSLTGWVWEEAERAPSTHHEIQIVLPPHPNAEYLFRIMECQPDTWNPWMEQSCQTIYLGTLQAPGF